MAFTYYNSAASSKEQKFIFYKPESKFQKIKRLKLKRSRNQCWFWGGSHLCNKFKFSTGFSQPSSAAINKSQRRLNQLKSANHLIFLGGSHLFFLINFQFSVFTFLKFSSGLSQNFFVKKNPQKILVGCGGSL